MRFITNIYYTIEGKQKVIPFVIDVDQNLPTYKQCIEASLISKQLMDKHVPKGDKVKDVHDRLFEEGIASFDLR